MISKKYQQLVLTFFTTLMMSGIISFVITGLNFGYAGDFLLGWLRAWGIAFALAFPAANLVSPIATKLMKLAIKQNASNL